MTELNSMPNNKEIATETKSNAFRIGATLFSGTIVATIFLLFLASQSGSWQMYAMSGVLTGVLALYFVALLMIRRGRLETGGRILITAVMVAILTGSFLVAGIGIVLGFTLVGVIYLVAAQTLQAKYIRPMLIVSIVVGILIALTDFLQVEVRLQVPALQAFVPIIWVLVLLVAGFFIAREAWSRSLTVSRKLYFVFSILFIFTLAIAASGLFGLGRVQDAYENTLAGGVEIHSNADTLNNALLKARRREKDFLLRWQEEGFDSAYISYVVPHKDHVTTMKLTLDELSVLAPVLGRVQLTGYSQDQYTTDLGLLSEDVIAYEQSFSKAVALIKERGFADTGLEGDFHTAVQTMEARIYDREGLDQLVITMLQIRHREKDYLLRSDQQYVDNVHDLVAELKSQAAASDVLTTREQVEITRLADDYLVKFDALVEKDQELTATTDVFRAAAAEIQTTTDRLAGVGEQLAVLDARTAQANSAQTFIITIVIVIVVLGASIGLAVILARQITRPILQLTNTATEIATGKFDVLAEVSSDDEIGTLAQTFNIMTQRLGAAFEDVRRRAAELATVADVSTATSTILETNILLKEVVNLTKERFHLYHSHIYLLDEKGESLVLTAGAGEPGRIMVSEGRSIPLDREQSLVARAARERKGVTVNDVTQAADFLPNPLLPETRSELAVPMMVGGNVIGVFDIQSEQVGRFTDADVNIQTTLAAQLATSIQNVRLFEQAKTQAEFETLVNAIGQKIRRTFSIEETLQTAIREMGLALGASRVTVELNAGNDNNGRS